MSVLEAPQTWIAAAAVLVVVAVVLIALAPRRRGAAGHDAGDAAASTPSASSGAASSGALSSVSSETGASDRGPDATDPTDVSGFDDDAVTAPVPPARGEATDDAVTAETPPQAAPVAVAAPATPAGGLPAADARRYVPVTDPARTGERAKDRLLAVLLTDPSAAVDVVAALPEGDGAASASGASAAALLRTGLSPAQVAGLCGVDERDLADLVARDLGLLEVVTGRDAASAQPGRSHTEEPGRAWASAGSSSSSTTPTTG